MATIVGSEPRTSPSNRVTIVLALILVAVVILVWRWVGYQGHDDASYAAAAIEWVERFPPLGTNHWSLRYPLVLPIAGLIAVFGLAIPLLAAVNVAAYAGFLVVGWVAARHWFGWRAAVALTLIGILVPQFPVQATYANPDLPEMALVMASFWLVMLARTRGGPWPMMLGAGVLAGTGFLTRETSLLLVPLYGLMFLIRPGMPRWRYLLIGVGFAAVVAIQMGWFAIQAGDPLYRLRISATHDAVDRGALAARAAGALDSEGVLSVGLIAAPFVTLFISQKFGLLFWLAIPAYVALRVRRTLGPAALSVVDWAAVGTAMSFLFVALNTDVLYVVPRYFMVTAAMAAVPLAVLAGQLSGTRPRATAAVALAFSASCGLLLYLENVRPMFAEQQATAFIAAQAAAGQPGTVYMEPETARRMAVLLAEQGLVARLSSAPPGPGVLVASKTGVAAACLRNPGCPRHEIMRAYTPDPAWTEVARFDPPRRWIGGLLREVGLAGHIPPDILRKIEQPGTTMTIYRTPS